MSDLEQPKEYGQTSSTNPSTSYEFTSTNRLIGMEGVSGSSGSTSTHIETLGPMTVETNPSLCTEIAPPPLLPFIQKVDGKKMIISNSTNITEPNHTLAIALGVTGGVIFLIFCVILPLVLCILVFKHMTRHKATLSKTKNEGNESLRNLIDDLEMPPNSSACAIEEASISSDTPIEETDNEGEMERRRLADVDKFANKLFQKMLFENAFARIDGKAERKYIAERCVEYIVKEVEYIVDDNERIKQEKLRWVMNQSMQTRLKLEMELEEQRISEEHNHALSQIEADRQKLQEEAEILKHEEQRRLKEAAQMRDKLRRELQEPVNASVKADVGDSMTTIKRKATLNQQEIKKQRNIIAFENKGSLEKESMNHTI